MGLEDIRATIPEYARDLRLNLGSVLTAKSSTTHLPDDERSAVKGR